MRRDIIAMSQKERQRYHLLKMVVESTITLKQASQMMGVSYRHGKRLRGKLDTLGAEGRIHGNRGRPSARALHPKRATRIIELSCVTYANLNDTHGTEKLTEIEGITVSRDTVRRFRRAHGIRPKRRRRAKRHFKGRPRKPQEGMMVLWDGSPHRWFGHNRSPCCLMAAIDDAKGTLCEAFFFPYVWLCRFPAHEGFCLDMSTLLTDTSESFKTSATP